MKKTIFAPTASVSFFIKTTPDQLRQFADRLEFASKEVRVFGQAVTVEFSSGIQLFFEPLPFEMEYAHDKHRQKLSIPPSDCF